ncbi:preprotein translocase subunit SecE [Azovibrio restrictus]|uniref:preprotein translocase subunit SecE n=1 Tax=Azovibrio restrictus TaxID=146938 RepID=UPI0026F25FB3|nr:preprotein translocase subunit SecE [Azovibrio restrictus]
MADKIKFALALLLVIAGVGGFYLLSGQALVLQVLAVMAGVVAGALVFWKTEPGQRFETLCRESVQETRKVVWPSRKETTQTTLMVFGFVVVMALFLYLTDKSLEWVMYDLILGWKKS